MNTDPDPIDIHVGSRIRYLRKQRGISQTKLANHLGVAFQQVQKYERAYNRISASMLFRVAQFLQEPVSFFYEGLESQTRPSSSEAQAILAAKKVPAICKISELSAQKCEAINDLISAML